jgi:hypothetical protein
LAPFTPLGHYGVIGLPTYLPLEPALLGALPVPLVLLGVSDGVGVPDAPDAPEEPLASGVVAVELEPLDVESGAVLDDEAGAGVLIGAAAGVLEVAGVAAESSFFLQPARAANTTAVANIVLRIIIDPPL